MAGVTLTTRTDSLLSGAEDIVFGLAAGIITWQASHNPDDVITALAATHAGKTVVAWGLTGARTRGLVKTFKLIYQWMRAINNLADEAALAETGKHEA